MSNILPNSLREYCCLGRDDVLVGCGTQFRIYRMLNMLRKNSCRNFLCALECYKGYVLPPKRRYLYIKLHRLRWLNTIILVFTTVITANLTLNYGLFNAEVTTKNWIT